jgi:hypothetical protein
MNEQWQDTTRGGDPVENVRPNSDRTWKWMGEVVNPDGTKSTLTWKQSGHHGIDGRPRDEDLIPLETPLEAPADPAKVHSHNRMVLALAATQYKRTCDATEAAKEAERLAHDALAVAFEQYGVSAVVVNLDGAAFLFKVVDGGVGFAEIEVL